MSANSDRAAYPSTEDDLPSRHWIVWLVALALALLWHGLLLWFQPNFAIPMKPPRVEVDRVDPEKLEAIRKQWTQKERPLLLNKKNHEAAEEAPENARYESDRNIRVEKEQRANKTNVIPKDGNALRDQEGKTGTRSQTRPQQAPKLGALGIPLKLENAKTQEESRPEQREGGDQALLEKDLPLGAENLLNAEKSVFYSFYARLYETMGPIWANRINNIPPHRTINPGEYQTTVEVVLNREGELIQLAWLRSAGIREFDEAVEYAWKKTGPFPNPPQGLIKEDGLVHMVWTFGVTVGEQKGFSIRYLPPDHIR